jgi:hypothetical protein
MVEWSASRCSSKHMGVEMLDEASEVKRPSLGVGTGRCNVVEVGKDAIKQGHAVSKLG